MFERPNLANFKFAFAKVRLQKFFFSCKSIFFGQALNMNFSHTSCEIEMIFGEDILELGYSVDQ